MTKWASGTLWNEDMDTDLKALVADKKSYTYAAIELNKQFGTAFTRNSCIGRACRIGLQKPPSAAGKSKRVRKPRERAVKSPAPTQAGPKITARRLAEMRCVPVEPLNLPLIELEHGQCRYPFGDGPILFCGHPQLSGSPYCGPHAALTINPDTKSFKPRYYRDA